MSFSKMLAVALYEDKRDDADVVALALGQSVEVRTKNGDLLVTGDITELNQETGVARIVDRGSGTDMNLDVDTELYDVWVVDGFPERKGSDQSPVQPRLAVHTKRPGAYAGGRF